MPWIIWRIVHSAGLAGRAPWPDGCDFLTNVSRFVTVAAQRTWVSVAIVNSDESHECKP